MSAVQNLGFWSRSNWTSPCSVESISARAYFQKTRDTSLQEIVKVERAEMAKAYSEADSSKLKSVLDALKLRKQEAVTTQASLTAELTGLEQHV